MRGAQVFGGDVSGDGGESGADEPFIDKCRYLLEDAVLLDHVRGLVDGAGEHRLPVQGRRFLFELADIDEVGVVDEGEGTLGGDEFDDLIEVLIGVGEADDVLDVLDAEFANLFAELLGVVDGVMGSGFEHPLLRFGTRGGADDGDSGEAAGELHEDGADAAGGSDDEQGCRLRCGVAISPASVGMRRRSKSSSQAVMEVSGRAAASAKESVRGLWPTRRSSTRWNSLLVPGRVMVPA